MSLSVSSEMLPEKLDRLLRLRFVCHQSWAAISLVEVRRGPSSTALGESETGLCKSPSGKGFWRREGANQGVPSFGAFQILFDIIYLIGGVLRGARGPDEWRMSE